MPARFFTSRILAGICGTLPDGEADDDQTRRPIGSAQGRIEAVAADRIVDDIGAGPVGDLAHALADVLGAVVDQMIGAMGLGDRELLGAAGTRR